MTAPPPPPGRRPSPQNKKSFLLSEEENQALFKLVGNRVLIQAAAVVQVYATEAPQHNSWHRKHCGVATFSKDNNRRSYYIQVYDIFNGGRLFEQEMYQHFVYHASLPFFHQFEGDKSMIGLSFGDEREATIFQTTVCERQDAKQRRREERRRQQGDLQKQQQQRVLQPQANTTRQPQQQQQQPASNNKSKNRYNKNRRGIIRKDEIGLPTGFRHITHVGFDPDNGFANFSEDEQLQSFFKLAGVDQNALDSQTREFIYDFIDKNGGIEQARKETKHYSAMLGDYEGSSASAGATPTANNNNVLSYNSTAAAADKPPPPPPPSTLHKVAGAGPPSLPARNAPPPPRRTPVVTHHGHPPPPPPPSATMAGMPTPPLPPTKSSGIGGRGPPPVPSGYKSTAPPPPPLSSSGRNPPPPPPPPVVTPMGGGGGRVPPPPPEPPVPAAPDSRSMLLDEIRSGKALKKVEVEERVVVTDKRSQLLDAIRQGKKLKPVDQENEGVEDGGVGIGVQSGPPVAGLAGALAMALQNRAKVIQDGSSDESDVSDDDEDDDWDDQE